MSLNGLDDIKAKEAHEAAVAEAGGWFLLNYVTRDEVQVLAQGSGGVAEMRTNVEQYEEPSPLFGFLRYRRRNVLIKYMPEGTSRLIQARSTVHFTAVCERFGPCETSIDITEAKELSETKLSHACSLHTASASTSSSHGSMRRRRLGEIAEEGEEEEPRVAKRQSVLGEQNTPGEIDDGPARPRSPITGPPVILDPSFATSPKDTIFADTAEPPSFSGVPRPASPAKSIESDFHRRMSSQSGRQEYSSSLSYPYSKPRVRLGPRPLTEQAGRPRSAASDVVRPVAAMPAGLRLALKGGKSVKTQDNSSSIINEELLDPTLLIPVASMTESSISRPHTSEGRPVVSSSASVKSLPAISQPAKQVMTPEKLRLMKALQLREKKKRASAVPEVPIPSVEITPSPAAETGIEIVEPVPEGTDIQNTLVRVPTDTESELTADEMACSKIDSAMDTASTAPTDHTSEHTHSRPHSPNCASSEIGDSTKASSVSETTDETVHPEGDKADGPADPQVIEEEALTHETSAGETDEKAISPSEVAEGTSVEGLAISTTTLGQPEQSLGAPDAGLPTTDDAKYAQGASDIEDNLVPKSKFAAKLPSGQAVMDPLEIRGRDPPNVTSGPGRIDEADPGEVGPLQRTEDGTGATSSKWNLPTSKYSTLDSSKSLAPSPNSAIATTSPDEPLNGQDRSADASDKMVDDGATHEKRRSERPEPLLIDSDLPEKPAPQQDEPVTVELQPATDDYEDAMSSMVHSPVTETPPQLCEPPTPRILRTVSSPVASPHSIAGDAPLTASRSISSGSMAFQQKMNQHNSSILLTPRTPGKLSSGLASRIKAFEQLATKNPAASSANSGAAGRPSSAFFSIQRNSVRDGARSPSVLERTNSIYRGRTATPESLDGSPEFTIGTSARSRSGSVVSRMSVFEGGNVPRGKPETVQVTAKIVREPGQMYPRAPGSQADTSEYAPMELRQSPLIVDHRKSVDVSEFAPATNAPPVPTPLVHAGERRQSRHERTLSKESKISLSDDSLHRPGQRTSLTMARDFIRDSMAGKDSPAQARPPSVHQSSSLLSRLSINTRRKSIPHEPSLLSPTDTNKSESGDENKSKEGSRASRLMHRLSSTFSPGRKQSVTMSPPILAEEFDVEEAQPRSSHGVSVPTTPSMPDILANLGDVNVQFPENLLWKRRTTYLDSTGFLHLTPAQGAVSAREKQLKRFHMSEFKAPYTPEIEFQELANSVCLDLKSGSGLQIAFQDRAGQLNGLQILQEAHQKHTSYGH